MYFGSIDYVHKLMLNGEIKKAHAFWEYCYRMEFQVQTTEYAKNWNVDNSTANQWISDFYKAINDEIQESKAKRERHTRALKKDR